MIFLFSKNNNNLLKNKLINIVGDFKIKNSLLSGEFYIKHHKYYYYQSIVMNIIKWINGLDSKCIWEKDENGVTRVLESINDIHRYNILKEIYEIKVHLLIMK